MRFKSLCPDKEYLEHVSWPIVYEAFKPLCLINNAVLPATACAASCHFFSVYAFNAYQVDMQAS
ncbi:hypothetical protein DUNSADRAFT_17190 [Dunaliella salina]|uniref:Uncharacterized protein n=1 Tax=Dunaliella salina TaxID=3046 RepID=A0ABQ7G279_DUNSA|nr:hypothetical protein DUNSADRAFT_17190 [Dunaliella salina]|eukprot:KAF5828706.1 hypothetical protein DUNSADRAFT_17190 [Dunaliella salina]